MSDKVYVYIETPKIVSRSACTFIDMIEKVRPDLFYFDKNGHKVGRGILDDLDADIPPGFVNMFLDNYIGGILTRSKETVKRRKFIKEICEALGTKEAWYATDMSLERLFEYGDPYYDTYRDWKPIVVKHSVELKRSFEKWERGENVWEPETEGVAVIFHHDDFWDLDNE